MGKIGEKIDIAQYALIKGDLIVSYIHSNKKNGSLLALNAPSASEEILNAGRQVGMQIVSMNPIALDKNDVPAEVVEREMEIGKELARQEGKPEAMLEKIATGRLNKFYEENTLLNQVFVIDTSKKISQMLDGVSKGLTVTAFKKVTLG